MKLKIPKIKKKMKKNISIRPAVRRLISGYRVIQRGKEKRKIKELYIERMAFPTLGTKVEALEKEKPKVKVKVAGIEIPSEMKAYFPKAFAPLPEVTEELENVDVYYSLIPHSPKKGEMIFAYAHIFWDASKGVLVYNVTEPPLSSKDKELVENIKRELEERLDVNFIKLGVIKARKLLKNEIRKSLDLIPELDKKKKMILEYYIERDTVGLGEIEPFMNDPEIEDISCDGSMIPIYLYHRNPRLGSLRTNIKFESKDELDTFVMRLAQRCGKSISIAEPLLDAALPDGSRLQATLGTDIARRGSNFTIRKFTAKPLTPTHMLNYGTLSSTQLAYLWLAVENGRSILISGGTATGKTCLLNALSLFIRPNLKILSIEDTPELRLPHIHWIPEVARAPLSIKGKIGEVTLFDLLKSSLRQRPDYIVLGEVRGKEAFVLFQQMATGHPSLATIHAASIPQLVDRLITPPISLPPSLLENIDVIIFLLRVRLKGRYVRRTNEIMEVVGVEKERPVTIKTFEWKPVADEFLSVGKSKVLENIAKALGLTEDSIQAEIMKRKKVLEWMLEKGIFDYDEVSRVINAYYSNPEKIMSTIEET